MHAGQAIDNASVQGWQEMDVKVSRRHLCDSTGSLVRASASISRSSWDGDHLSGLQVLAEQQALLRQQQFEGHTDRPRFMYVDRRAEAQLDVRILPHVLPDPHVCWRLQSASALLHHYTG